jgi:hypothetical protein
MLLPYAKINVKMNVNVNVNVNVTETYFQNNVIYAIHKQGAIKGENTTAADTFTTTTATTTAATRISTLTEKKYTLAWV